MCEQIARKKRNYVFKQRRSSSSGGPRFLFPSGLRTFRKAKKLKMEKRDEFSNLFERYEEESVENQSRILCFLNLSEEIRRDKDSRDLILRNFDEILAKSDYLVGNNIHLCDFKLFSIL